MLDDQKLFLTQLVTLLAVLDPVGHLTLFLATTQALSARDRRRSALSAVPIAFVVLTAFAVGGQFVLHAMGISLLAFQVAGGVILFLFSITMVLGPARTPEDGATSLSGGPAALAVYPLAVPVIAGPGSILTVMVLMDNNRGSLGAQALTLVALAMVLALLLGVFVVGDTLGRLLGTGGANVLRRIMGLVLASLSVNLILSALADWLHLPPI